MIRLGLVAIATTIVSTARLPLQIRDREHLLRRRLRELLGGRFTEALYRELLNAAMDPTGRQDN